MPRDLRRLLPLTILAAQLGLASRAGAQTTPPPRPPFVEVRLHLELGFLSALHHTIQYGKNGTRFDFVSEGGQDTLFFFARPTAEVLLAQRHSIIFVYQPLQLAGQVRLRRDVLIDE